MNVLRTVSLKTFNLRLRALLASVTIAAALAPLPASAYNLSQNSAVFEILNAAGDNSWVRLDQNDFDSVWAAQNQTLQSNSFAQQFKIIEAWSSFAWDSNRGKLIFWGGGHANYTGNDVYTFNINSLLWERGSLPSAIERPAPGDFSISYTTVDGVDHAPISSHTYDSQFYFRNADRFVTMGGAAYNDGDTFNRYVQNADGSYRKERTGPYFWDPAKADPNKVGGLTGSHVNPHAYPDVVGGEMWQNRDSARLLGGTIGFNTTSAVDPDPTIDRALLQNNGGLYEYIAPDVNDPSLDTISRIGRYGNNTGITEQGVAGFDPIRNVYLRSLDSGRNRGHAFTIWDLSAAPGGPDCPSSTEICNTLIHRDDIDVVGGVFDYENLYFYAVDFDPNRNAFVLWAGTENVWSLELPADLATGRWTLTQISSPTGNGPAIARETNPYNGIGYARTGILGSWKYVPELDVFLGSHDGRGQIWAFKPANWQFADNNTGGGTGDGTLLDDDFNDGNLDGWSGVTEDNASGQSDWAVRAGKACQNSDIFSGPTTRDSLPKLGGYLQYQDNNFASVNISLTMSSGDDDALGVMFRVQDSQNYYRFSWDRQRSYRRLVKNVNGVFTLLAEDSIPYELNRDYEISITADGPMLNVTIDGAAIFTVNDGDIDIGTIALYTWANKSSCFDNIIISGPNGGGNNAPEIQAVTATPTQITSEESAQLSVTASDIDGDNLTYLWSVPAGAGSFDDPSSDTPTFLPASVFSPQNIVVSVSVSDGVSVRSGEVTVTVLPSSASNSLSENFDDGDYTGWTAFDEGALAGPSNWTARDSKVCQDSNIYSDPTTRDSLAKRGSYLRYDDGNFDDASISLTLSSGDDDALGVMFRVQDSQNYYRFSWDQQRGYRRLVKSVNGVFTLLAEDSTPYAPNRNYRISITADGPMLDVAIDSESIFTTNDSSIDRGTIALYTWANQNSCFDNIVVSEPNGGGNNAPVIQSVTASPTQITDQQSSQLSVTASDSDGDTLTYLWELPAGAGSFDDPDSETPSYFPASVFSPQNIVISVSVSDGISVRSSEVTVTVSPSSANNAFNENFDDGDYIGWRVFDEGNIAGPSNWTARDGKVCQDSNIYSDPTTRDSLAKRGSYLQYQGDSFASMNIRSTLSSGDNDALGMMFRVQDSQNYYRFSWDRQRGYRRLVKSVNGVFTLLAEDSTAYALNRDYEISITADGQVLNVTIDGLSIFTVNDGAINSGAIALYTWGNQNSCFDNIVVNRLNGGGNNSFYDNFNDGDLDGWTVFDSGTHSGPSNWQVSNGVLRQSSNIYSLPLDRAGLEKAGSYLSYDGGSSFADFSASLTLRSDDNDAIGVLFRVQDNDNYYRFSWDHQRNYRRLVKKVNGVFTLLAEDSVPYGRFDTHRIQIEAVGENLQLTIDGKTIFSIVDGDINSGTIGLYSWGNVGSYFDEILVIPQ